MGVDDYVNLNRTIPSHCCQQNSFVRTYLAVWKDQLCYASQVTKPGCHDRLAHEFQDDQKIVIIQLMISGLIKMAFLGASFVIPFEQKVLLTENHDAVSLASTISMGDLEDQKEMGGLEEDIASVAGQPFPHHPHADVKATAAVPGPVKGQPPAAHDVHDAKK